MISNTPEYEYMEVSICDVENMLKENYEIEVNSPDGWVQITDYIKKGKHDEYVMVSKRGEIVRCSGTHLFESDIGWIFAEDMVDKKINILHDDGNYYSCTCVKTGNQIEIVDVTVDHDNHRYFSNGVSSHNTGAGKSLFKCHMAAQHLLFGRNVLYITMELAEEEVARRIDANIMDITLDEVREVPLDVLEKRMSRFKDKTPGKLIIKEYPTGSAHSGHFRHLLNELRLKKNFKPDVIFVDYLNICASARVKGAASANSYTLVKSIAEEIRGLAMEFDVAIVTSSQLNRSGYENSDVDLTNISESMGTSHTSDAIFALITSEELESMGQLMVKQLKNRWGDLSYFRRFVIGIDRSKMKLYNLEDSAQKNVNFEAKQDKPAFDKGAFSEQWDNESKGKRGKKKQLFEVGELT